MKIYYEVDKTPKTNECSVYDLQKGRYVIEDIDVLDAEEVCSLLRRYPAEKQEAFFSYRPNHLNEIKNKSTYKT